jgi:hypothetical protein
MDTLSSVSVSLNKTINALSPFSYISVGSDEQYIWVFGQISGDSGMCAYAFSVNETNGNLTYATKVTGMSWTFPNASNSNQVGVDRYHFIFRQTNASNNTFYRYDKGTGTYVDSFTLSQATTAFIWSGEPVASSRYFGLNYSGSGTIKSFTSNATFGTSVTIPMVTNITKTGIGASSTVSFVGGDTFTSAGFIWSDTNNDPTISI